MKELTNEQIIALIRKHRLRLLEYIDNHLCLEHYNTIHELDLKEKDVELQKSVCIFCNKEKDCVKKIF